MFSTYPLLVITCPTTNNILTQVFKSHSSHQILTNWLLGFEADPLYITKCVIAS